MHKNVSATCAKSGKSGTNIELSMSLLKNFANALKIGILGNSWMWTPNILLIFAI